MTNRYWYDGMTHSEDHEPTAMISTHGHRRKIEVYGEDCDIIAGEIIAMLNAPLDRDVGAKIATEVGLDDLSEPELLDLGRAARFYVTEADE